MLSWTDDVLMAPIHILCCNPTATDEMIQVLKDAQPHEALMRNVLNKTPLLMILERVAASHVWCIIIKMQIGRYV
jgi:hypothetical protein